MPAGPGLTRGLVWPHATGSIRGLGRSPSMVPTRRQQPLHGTNHVFACPHCGGRRKVLAEVTTSQAVRSILQHWGLPSQPGRLSPARGPPQRGGGLSPQQSSS
ncbi:uncharacterized protein STAUR_7732 [Stigmatella aurantiaca DW4/3-1]|uniref:ATP-dependent helicase HrpA n=1 Tax=Stigmatella aurantiaca (strain DW4/3-1) TaxID=378806 RepID=E3FKB8_STIAD|nr:uncharacterized protein STAUR_7732 [Stigmatella aurantiaca DW4/3-1]